MSPSFSRAQSEYYASTAHSYDSSHASDYEHTFALTWLLGIVQANCTRTILDVGSGTGRVPSFLSKLVPDLAITSLEPSAALREISIAKCIPNHTVIDGSAYRLPYSDNSFDIVTCFGSLHHMEFPHTAIREMFRVSRYGLFLSDTNNFGQGNLLQRSVKQLLYATRLFPLYNYIATRGKNYHISEGDGLFYSYSLFSELSLLKKLSKEFYILNTRPFGGNHFRTSSHIALYSTKCQLFI